MKKYYSAISIFKISKYIVTLWLISLVSTQLAIADNKNARFDPTFYKALAQSNFNGNFDKKFSRRQGYPYWGSRFDLAGRQNRRLDHKLYKTLAQFGFTGNIERKFEQKLGRPINPRLARLGQMLFFDIESGLNNDNSCAGCHSPMNGWGDSQPMSIGVDNNGMVGPSRTGPRNQRRAPSMANTALYPALMWNSRFFAVSGDPFNNKQGFVFPDPEGKSLSKFPHLLVAQAFIPPTERVEAAGFEFPGNNDDIRAEVVNRLNAESKYTQLFGRIFPTVAEGKPVTFTHFAQAIAEFEFTQIYANAPLDRYARGEIKAMTRNQKLGALLFFGKANCVQCHQVGGQSNEMFSDFKQHVIGVPQIVPSHSNMTYDGPGQNEDFGLEQISKNPEDRYMFRTAPLRNAAVMPAYMHNGAFVTLEDAIRHHLNPYESGRNYKPQHSELPTDLCEVPGPIEPVLDRLDPLLRTPVNLTDDEFKNLVEFVKFGLLDPSIAPERLKRLIPTSVPSGNKMHNFEDKARSQLPPTRL